MKILVLCLSLVLIVFSAEAEAYRPIKGNFKLGGKTFYDPPADELQNTHMYFDISDSAAEKLYGSMRVKASKDICNADGSLTKRIGGTQCTKSADGKEYRCWFGIDVKQQKIVTAAVC